MFKRFVLASVTAATLAFSAAGASAAPSTALWLAMDGSGSISGADFTTQISGYVAALTGFFTNHPTAYGQVALGGSIFGRDLITFAPLTVINDAAGLAALLGAISALNPGRGGIDTSATSIGDAVAAGTAALTAFEAAQGVDLRLVIDVTTDGVNNNGLSPVTASNSATAAGVNAVNCLSIGPGGSCAFIGANGTNFGNVTFASLGAALERKIAIETGIVPAPMTLALVGLGLVGVGLSRRRVAA